MSDKAELKKLKKEAELAEETAHPLIGERFPTTYSWGYRLLQTLCSIEERIRNLEQRLVDAVIPNVKFITSNSVIFHEHTEEIDSDTTIYISPEQNINSDATIE